MDLRNLGAITIDVSDVDPADIECMMREGPLPCGSLIIEKSAW